MEKAQVPVITGIALLLMVGGALSLTQCSAGAPDVIDGPTMLYFYAEWWEVCQAMEPIVDGLEDEHGGRLNLVRINIDTDRGKQLAREHGFIGQPTFIFFDRSEEETRRLQGPQSRETLELEIGLILEEWESR